MNFSVVVVEVVAHQCTCTLTVVVDRIFAACSVQQFGRRRRLQEHIRSVAGKGDDFNQALTNSHEVSLEILV